MISNCFCFSISEAVLEMVIKLADGGAELLTVGVTVGVDAVVATDGAVDVPDDVGAGVVAPATR